MPGVTRWTSAMRQAWSYVVSAVDRDMSPTSALREYRAGGGAIRTQDWYWEYNVAKEAASTFEAIERLPLSFPIPDIAFTTVDMKWARKYNVVADVSWVDAATGETVRQAITVQSDEVIPLEEWDRDIQETARRYPGTTGATININRMFMYTPAGR